MVTEEDLRKLIESNHGVDLGKIQKSLEKLRATGIAPRGYRLASPLDARRYRARVKDPKQPVRLRTRR